MVEGVLAMGKIWERADVLSSLEPLRDSEATVAGRKMAEARNDTGDLLTTTRSSSPKCFLFFTNRTDRRLDFIGQSAL
jgi:hypothetical protein